MTIDRALNGLLKLAIALAVAAGVVLSVVAVVNTFTQNAQNERAAGDRRALMQRNAELSLSAMTPGSALACLDAGAGDEVEAACEARVFADPRSAAGAVAYTAARLSLLAEAQAAQPSALQISALQAMAGPRRAIELDRYGIAAHVLATRDGCTPENCAAFAFLRDTAALKANLKARVYDQYVSRYAAAWSREPDKQVPVAALPGAATVPGEPTQATGVPVSSKYDFPSAASIPPVSIMNSEPALPKTAQPAKSDGKADAKPDEEAVPVPPRRPQTQAATPSQPQTR